jgi:hypothetical protein
LTTSLIAARDPPSAKSRISSIGSRCGLTLSQDSLWRGLKSPRSSPTHKAQMRPCVSSGSQHAERRSSYEMSPTDSDSKT